MKECFWLEIMGVWYGHALLWSLGAHLAVLPVDIANGSGVSIWF
jgi:hypothetical protein